jgi:thioredoxin 1
MSEQIGEATDATFEELVVNSDVPVLVDFWAPWCGPCRMVGPALEEIAGEYEGKVKVVKVNVDENQQIAGSHGIRSIPTIILYSDGKEQQRIIGLRPKGDFASMIDEVVSN